MSNNKRSALQSSSDESQNDFSNQKDEEVIKGCPKNGEDWIEFSFVDDDGEPLKNEPYTLILPNNVTQEGTLDSTGSARIEDIASGSCKISFPKRDYEEWELYDENARWLDIFLEDDDGLPVAEADYIVSLPDQTEIKGKLNAKGKARIENIPSESVKVSFPSLHGDEWDVEE